MTEPTTLVLLVGLGTWAALDGTSMGQVMISRPLVSGTLTGWILGDPGAGFLIGGILEAAHLAGIPVGGVRLPEPGPAAVPAVVAGLHLGGPGGIAVGVGLGVFWSLVSGGAVAGQRRLNGMLTRGVDEGRVSERGLVLRHWGCIALDGVRGALLTLLGVGIAQGIPLAVADAWGFEEPGTTALLLLPGALAAGMLLRSWTPSGRRGALFVAGLVGGVVLALGS